MLLTRELTFGGPKRRTSSLRSHLNFSSVAVVGTTGWSRRAGDGTWDGAAGDGESLGLGDGERWKWKGKWKWRVLFTVEID